MESLAPITAAEIRELLVRELEGTANAEMSYEALWALIRRRGLVMRGKDRKGQLKYVYGAIANDKRFEKIRPGVFVLAKPVRSGKRV